MVQLSVVIITYNEEKNIARCLQSVQEIADEIVVVDSSSTDKTEEICRSFGAKFIQHKFENYYQQKNFAMEYAGFDCVLSLDADEELSEELKKSILKVKQNWDADGYSFNRLTNFCGSWIKHSGWYPDCKIRLWNRQKGRWASFNPHEVVELKPGSKQKFLEGDLNHYSYTSKEEFKERTYKYSKIGAESLYNQGKRITSIKLIVDPVARFVKHYFVKLGILDGVDGFYIAWIMAKGNYFKYSELRRLNRSKKQTICFQS